MLGRSQGRGGASYVVAPGRYMGWLKKTLRQPRVQAGAGVGQQSRSDTAGCGRGNASANGRSGELFNRPACFQLSQLGLRMVQSLQSTIKAFGQGFLPHREDSARSNLVQNSAEASRRRTGWIRAVLRRIQSVPKLIQRSFKTFREIDRGFCRGFTM